VSTVSKDSAAYGSTTNSVTEIGATGIYTLDLTATEMTVASNATVLVSSSSANTAFLNIPFEPHLESGVVVASTGTSVTLRSGASAVSDLYNGSVVEIIRGTGAGQARTVTDYVGSTQVATVDRSWFVNPDTTSVYTVDGIGIQHGTDIMAKVNVSQINAIAGAATALGYLYQGGVIQTSVNDSSPSTTSWVCAAGLSATDDFYNNGIVIFVTGTLAGLAREMTDYDGDTLTITTNAFPSAPANGDKFAVLGRVF